MSRHASASSVVWACPSQYKRRQLLTSLVGIALLHLAPQAYAHGTHAGDLLLDHAYGVPSAPGETLGKAYLRGIKNSGAVADRLLSASTPVAASLELQSLKKHGNDWHAEAVTAIELPANSTTLLRHTGDYQLLLRGLKHPLKDGERFELTLNFARAGAQTVKVWVQTPRDLPSGNHSH